MFGKNKQKKLQKLKEEKEAAARAAEKQREEEAHAALLERYKKAVEYDKRVAAGEDPDLVEREVYGQPEVEETIEEPVEEEATEEVVEETIEEPVEEETAEEVVEEEAAEEVVEEETAEEPVEEETAEEVVEEETAEEPVEEEAAEEVVEEETAEEPAEKLAKKTAKKSPAKKDTAPKKADSKKTASKKEKEEDANEKILVEADPSDTTNGKYEIFQETGGYKYRIVASNGQILATSEVYTTAKGAQNGIDTLKSNLSTLVFRIETDKHRKSQFVGCTAQNKILVHSANYSSKSSAESAIDSFNKFAIATKIVLLNNEDESKPELVDRTLFKKAAGKGKFVILFNQDTLSYQFGLKASNGQLIVTSKFYKSDVSVKSAITKFKKDVKEGTFFIIRDKNGMYEFRLYNAANKLVQSGIAFDSKTKCLSNIESVIRFIDSELESK